MSVFLASIETTTKGTFTHGYHLGTDERVARACAEQLLGLKWSAALGWFDVRTVGLMRDGQLIDTFDGDWSSVMLDTMYAEYLDDLDRADARYHGA